MSYQQHYDIGADPELAELLAKEKIDPSTLSALYTERDTESARLLEQQNRRLNKLESLLFLLLKRNGMQKIDGTMEPAEMHKNTLYQETAHLARRHVRSRHAYNDGQRYDMEEVSFSH